MRSREIASTPRTLTQAGLQNSSARQIPENSIILSTRAPIGHLAINKQPMAFNQGCRGIVPGDHLDHHFLYYFLLANRSELNELGAGATFKELSTGALRSFAIPLPPLDEQKRIVEVLDQAFAALDLVQRNAEKNLIDAKEMLNAGLDKVIARNSQGGVETTLGEVCDFENGDRGENYPGRKAFVAQGVAFINAGHLDDGQIDWARMNYIPEEHFRRLSKGKVRKDDILFCLRGSLGKFGKVDRTDPGAIASSLVIVRAGHRIAADFLGIYFKSRQSKKMVDKYAGGAAQPNLSASDLKKFTIVLPGLDYQHKAIAECKELLANAGQVRSSYEMKCGELDSLRRSLLQAAFSGQLT